LFFRNRILYRVRPTKGGSAVPIARVLSLQDAMAEGGQADDYLLGTEAADPGLLADDVSNLKAYRKNSSDAFADEFQQGLYLQQGAAARVW
jgi:hypothetical protein